MRNQDPAPASSPSPPSAASASPRAAGAAAARRPAAPASSPTTRSSSACSTTSPASTRTCPARTPRSPSRWPSTTTRPSTATRRSRRPSRSSRPTTRTRPTSPTARRRRCTTGRTPTSSSTCRTPRPRWPSPPRPRRRRSSTSTSAPATTALTGAQCNKYTFHWAYDTAMLAKGTAGTIVGEGGKNWNIVYPDYAFGQDMNKSFTAAVKGAGGKVGPVDRLAVPQRQLRDVHHQGRRRQPAGHRDDARRRRPHQLRQAVQPEPRSRAGPAGRRPDVHHRHPLARRRPVRRHPVHRRVVLELRRAEQGLGRQVHRQDPDPAVVRPRRELLRRA